MIGDDDGALTSTNRGWLESGSEDAGPQGEQQQPAKAIMYIFRWRSEADEREFKTSQVDFGGNVGGLEEAGGGGLPLLAVDSFFARMKGLGMVGWRAQHCYFTKG